MRMNLPDPGRWLLLVCASCAGVLLIGVLVWWFLDTHERVAEQVPVEEQRKPPEFAAAAAYLRASGHEVALRSDMRFFASLPETDALLVLGPDWDSKGRAVKARLASWVEAGGHLVAPHSERWVKENEPQPGADNPLEGLVQPRSRRTSGQGRQSVPGKGDPLLFTRIRNQPVTLGLCSVPQLSPQAPFLPEWRLNGERSRACTRKSACEPEPGAQGPSALVSSPADWLERFRVGKGSLTVLSDSCLFSNNWLGKQDNAFLLTELARNHHKVCFWTPDPRGTDSLWLLLFREYPGFLVTLVLLLAVLLWSMQTRLHPPVALPLPARRDVLASFAGAGRFAWRVNRAQGLLAGNREALARMRKSRRTGWLEEQGETPRTQRAASADQITQAERLALEKPVRTEADLVRVSRAMFQLNQSLRRRKGAGRKNGAL